MFTVTDPSPAPLNDVENDAIEEIVSHPEVTALAVNGRTRNREIVTVATLHDMDGHGTYELPILIDAQGGFSLDGRAFVPSLDRVI